MEKNCQPQNLAWLINVYFFEAALQKHTTKFKYHFYNMKLPEQIGFLKAHDQCLPLLVLRTVLQISGYYVQPNFHVYRASFNLALIKISLSVLLC
jgi:hypothetical protein